MTDPREEVVLNKVLTAPNVITLTRILLIPVFGWAFLTGRDVPALVLLVIIGSTDWVDGFVARRFGQVSKLGKLLDPVADRMAIVTVLLVLVFRDVVPLGLAAVLLLRDLIVTVAFPVLEAKGFPRIAVNWTGKWATAFIFVGMALAAASVLEWQAQDGLRNTSIALLTVGAVLYWAAGALYVKEIRKLMNARTAG